MLFHKEINNHSAAIAQLIKEIEKIDGFEWSKAVFCMEHTGMYNNPLLNYLFKRNMHIWLESASQIKYSSGNIRGKNDKNDAILIGKYTYRHRDNIKLWKPKRDILQNLLFN